MENLPRSESLKVETKTEIRRFRFGDGETYTSSKLITLPIMVGSAHAKLDTHIIDSDIPLLLSRDSLKKADAEIDFRQDTIHMLGEKVHLKISTTGHLLLPLSFPPENCLLTSPIQPDNENTQKQIIKLHKQFAHPSADRLKNLIRNSGTNDKSIDKIIDSVTNDCDSCKRFKKTSIATNC